MISYKIENITVFQSSLYMTTTAIVETEDVMIMTDPNWLPSEVAAIRKYVDEHIGTKQLYIIYTHSDFDHIIGSGAFPDAKVIATEELQRNEHKEEIIKKIHAFDSGYYLQRNYEPHYPRVDYPVTHDGQILDLGQISLTFYKAPGHTSDCLFTIIEPLGIFLSGDYLSDVEFPFIFSSFKDYLNTMDKAEYILKTHHINLLIPGHGSITEDKQEIDNRLNDSKFYLNNLLNEGDSLEKYCREKYAFYEGIGNIHLENRKLAKKESVI
ncbi:MBL fold metallo-hydrolase [Rossellomorea sp. NS-SX7]|uniref:MBL fold metallo-hydrolase n=1 Tax=Rossellomorea sp. NS-SX7 TaxID=3463856 RepID=UPI00405A0EEC